MASNFQLQPFGGIERYSHAFRPRLPGALDRAIFQLRPYALRAHRLSESSGDPRIACGYHRLRELHFHAGATLRHPVGQAKMTTTEPIVTAIQPQASGLSSRLLNSYLRLANKPLLACGVVFFLTLGLRIALLPWLPVPRPAVHDEFSYLLAAEPIASGGVTNPPHKYWEHFETFHVLQQPTYASKYQPMQGLVLAFGQKLFGLPWAGVLLSSALMCAIVCWTLQGWLSPGLALLGGLLVMLKVGVLSYWVNTYWGGCVAAIAIALTIGSRSEEHTSELQSHLNLVCRLLLEKKKI